MPGDPEVVGWLDTAGVFTVGPAPADAGPCTAGCIDTVCRLRCDDTDGDGDGDGEADATYSELWCVRADGTAELVLTYQDDPSAPYTPTAPVDCTYGTEAHEALTLCEDAGPFLRRYSWINGSASFEDVELDGTTPHVVTGTVGVCTSSSSVAECAEQTTPGCNSGPVPRRRHADRRRRHPRLRRRGHPGRMAQPHERRLQRRRSTGRDDGVRQPAPHLVWVARTLQRPAGSETDASAGIPPPGYLTPRS
ncbi:hypothetical protein, partial [Streptomyces sp. NPDC095817]|uniref:hypothetical protein n=1 Tax=Streptomyces sp. NPDC095817 TaxID=3155082 RepID=UPI0033285817